MITITRKEEVVLNQIKIFDVEFEGDIHMDALKKELCVGSFHEYDLVQVLNSLSNALCLFKNITIYLVSPPELRMPQEILHDLNKTNVTYIESDNIEDIINDVDVLYVTRIQKERFADIEEYKKIKGAYIVNKKMLEGKDLIVMHPLPRIDEIDGDVDDTKYNKYFTQAANAVPVRMAILKTLIKNNPK